MIVERGMDGGEIWLPSDAEGDDIHQGPRMARAIDPERGAFV
jgi:hypothetical protein